MVDIDKRVVFMVNVDYIGKVLGSDDLKRIADRVNERAEDCGVGLGRSVEVIDGEMTYVPIDGTILVNEVVSDMFPGVYVSTRAEKENALVAGLGHKGVYSYDSLCLGGVDLTGDRLSGRELDLASRLMRGENDRREDAYDIGVFGDMVSRSPALVPIANLGVMKDEDFGFRYVLNSMSGVDYKKVLRCKGTFNEVDSITGVPVLIEGGSRQSFPNDGMLRGVCLVGGLGLYADDGDWSDADGDSRVVVTDTRGASRS